MFKDALKDGPVWALGAMSGTSLDGVDAAMVLTDGAEIFAFGTTRYRAYTEPERDVLRAAMGRWEDLGDAASVVEAAHLEVLAGFPGVDIVGFHGQTTAHDPGGRGTCQIGDGRRMAHGLDVPVVWDFRSADVESGGQGAPLAPFCHHALMRHVGETDPVAVLNLGGVGNLTLVDPRVERPSDPGACLAFDTGPANAPLNDLMLARLGLDHDEGGTLASTGTPDASVLERLASHAYLRKAPPKSLDRNDFTWLGAAVADLDTADAAATLTAAVAQTVAAGLARCPVPPTRVLVTGGGRHNATMMAWIEERAQCPVEPVETVGLDGDMLEAQAFAYLAVRVARGWPTSAPGTTGVPRPVGGGILSRPGDILEIVGE